MRAIRQLFSQFSRFNRWWQPLRRRSKVIAVAGALLGLSAIAMLLVSIGGYLWLSRDLPAIDHLQAGLALPSTRLYDRQGRLLYEIIDPKGGRNTAVPLSQIPPALVKATIDTEDKTFYNNPGVDIGGIVRALWINVRGGEVRSGGSTITQQVARNLLLDPQERAARTLSRKLRESILAIRLAQSYSRDDILTLYLNQTYYGNLAYGVQAAAQVYFAKDVSALDLAESSLLAGLPQAPATYDPLTNPSGAKDRQKEVLRLMVAESTITQVQADDAANEPLQFASGHFPIEAPHFVVKVWDELAKLYPDQLYQGGLEVTTTLNLDWQHAAESIARRQIAALNTPADGSPSHKASDAALVAIDPHTGQVLAMLGSVDYFDQKIGGAVNMAIAPRQPGSALKPFTYSLAFDPTRPDPWSPSTMLLDISTPFVTRKLQSYTPANFGLAEHGPVSIREALASSYNIPAVITLDHVGVPNLVNLLHTLGISTLNDAERLDLSITLGGGEVRLLDLTTAYAAFDNSGSPVPPADILTVKDKTGRVLYQWHNPTLPATSAIDPRVVFLINNILSDNNARLPEFGSHSALQIGRTAAAKTGTTTDFRDNWTMGYTPDLVVGVWVGNADNTPMKDVSGVTGAGPIWNEFMRTVLADQPDTPFPQVAGVEQVEVCALSGLLPTPLCPNRRLDWFISGHTPTAYDNMYQKFTLDRVTGVLATAQTPPNRRQDRVFVVLPQEAHDWAVRHGIPQPPTSSNSVAIAQNTGGSASSKNAGTTPQAVNTLRILSPDPYTIFQLTPLVPFDTQQIRFTAAVPDGTQQITYTLDDQTVGSTDSAPWSVWWALTPGTHKVIARATLADGSIKTSDALPFSVKGYVPPDAQPTAGTVQ